MFYDAAITAIGVSKQYLIYDKPEDRLKQMIAPRLVNVFRKQKLKFYREFTAVDDVTLKISKGETVGIVGRNGSGKSTLLQLICGTLQPTQGEIKVQGRIAALLELGSGFNPDFTGRENVFLNASILGLSRPEIEARFDDIVDFSGIREFIDQPVKTYSSGMYVRLAFAVATNVDPDILIVDEALSVGDEAFQRKCFARIEQIKDRGSTILLVSHGAQTIIQLCDRAILLDRGENILTGSPKHVVKQYQRLLSFSGSQAEMVRQEIVEMEDSPLGEDEEGEEKVQVDLISSTEFNDVADSAWFDESLNTNSAVEYGQGDALIHDIRIVRPSDNNPVNVLTPGKTYDLYYSVKFQRPFTDISFGTLFKTVDGIELGGMGTVLNDQNIDISDTNSIYEVRMRFDCKLRPGVYFCNTGVGFAMGGGQQIEYLHRIMDALCFRVSNIKSPNFSGHVDFGIECQVRKIASESAHIVIS